MSDISIEPVGSVSGVAGVETRDGRPDVGIFTYGSSSLLVMANKMNMSVVWDKCNFSDPAADIRKISAARELGLQIVFRVKEAIDQWKDRKYRTKFTDWLEIVYPEGLYGVFLYDSPELAPGIIQDSYKEAATVTKMFAPSARTVATFSIASIDMSASICGYSDIECIAAYNKWGGPREDGSAEYLSDAAYSGIVSSFPVMTRRSGSVTNTYWLFLQAFYDTLWGETVFNGMPGLTSWDTASGWSSDYDGYMFYAWSVIPAKSKRIQSMAVLPQIRQDAAMFAATKRGRAYVYPEAGFVRTGDTMALDSALSGVTWSIVSAPAGTTVDSSTGVVTAGMTTGKAVVKATHSSGEYATSSVYVYTEG